jgi:hypothetical protein
MRPCALLSVGYVFRFRLALVPGAGGAIQHVGVGCNKKTEASAARFTMQWHTSGVLLLRSVRVYQNCSGWLI